MASNKTSNQTSENQDDNQWPRFLIMEAADKNIPLNLNAIDGKRQSVEWQMLTLTMSNQ